MKLFILLAILGSALALQAPVEYVYQYQARVATGMQAGRPQYAGTGLTATVKVTMEHPDEGLIEVSDVKVGEQNQVVGNNGRDEMDIQYQPIQDKALELPFKAHFSRQDGEAVLEVPETDLLWVTNIRRGIAAFFRIAPLVDPSSVKPSPAGGPAELEPQAFSRVEDTYAGRCKVSYTVTPASVYDVPNGPTEDIQAQSARKGPGGCAIKIKPEYYRVQSSIDFSTCSDRVVLLQTGAGNLTNVTSSTYRDVASRSQVSQYIIQGSPGKFRIQSGVVESQFIMNPFGVEADKAVIVSNQTMQLEGARPVPRGVQRAEPKLKLVHTWRQQVQSPHEQPQGYSPRWIQYQPQQQSQSSASPAFFEQMVSGFQMTEKMQNDIKNRVQDALKGASQKLAQQNRDNVQEPKDYGGSVDGRAAQDLNDCHRLIRALSSQKLREIDSQFKQQNCQICSELFVETLAVAGTGPSLELLMDKIQQGDISDNRTASIFFNLANNIQSPEAIEKMMKFVMSLQEQQRVTVSLLSKINFSLLARRLCISPQLQSYSHMQYIFGKQMCDRSMIISQYLPHLEQKINSDQPIWVRILNVIAAADLGAKESLDILAKVASGEASQDRFLRYAAIHGMAVDSFDNSARDQIFNILQPIAESQVEDYRIRQVAYNSLLSWKPNVTFLQRMVASSQNEPSKQMQSFIYWVVDSLARVQDDSFQPLSSAARNLLPVTRYMNPSVHRSMNYISSTYLRKELIGATDQEAWLSEYKAYFPREIYSFIAGKYGRFSIPLLETVTVGNSQSMVAKLRSFMEGFGKQGSGASAGRRSSIHQQIHAYHGESQQGSSSSGAAQESPAFYHYSKLFRTSQVFLPLTDELYSQIKSSVASMTAHSGRQAQHITMHKYMNPVEVNVMQPTPVGLWMHTQISTPTIMYAAVDVAVSGDMARDPSQLPALQRLDLSAEGIVKIVAKVNAYTYVLAPWTNKTLIVAVDNEKSASMPMKYQIAADLQMPARQLWGQITPTFQASSEKIPVLKVRNVPYTAIGKILPSPGYPQEIESFKQVQWLYSKDQWTQGSMPISRAYTGLNAEIAYRGEPQFPLNQANIYDYMKEPSRQLALLASPSVKNYELTLYQLPGASPTKSIGFAFRHIMQPGSQSGPQIQVPASAHQPADISAQDSLQQREQKIAQFSNQENHEYSAQLNFTGGAQPKKYEASIIIGQDERNVNQETVKRFFSKVQVSLLQQNQDSQNKPKTCFVSAINRPELRPMSTPADLKSAHQQQSLSAPAAASLYEGSSCGAAQQPMADAQADLTVSENRLKEIMKVTDKGDFSFNTTSEFYRLAVYDHLKLTVNWQTPSPQVQNATYRAQDLAEGYLFPKLVKNYFAPNQPKRMVVVAERSISDDRANAWVYLPKETCHAERISIQPWFDQLTGFTPAVYSVAGEAGHSMKSSSPSHQCFVHPSQVMTFDGVTYAKAPTACSTIVAKVEQGDDSIAVVTSKASQSSSQSEVRILSAKEGLDITIQGQRVQVNGEQMSHSQKSKRVVDGAGNTLARIERTADTVDVSVANKLQVFIKQGSQLMVKLDQRFRDAAQGLCGDFNSESKNDMRGPKGCVYSTSQGPAFAASWLAHESQCYEHRMQSLIGEVQQYQPGCSKGHQAVSTSHDCEIQGYPIYAVGDTLCVTESKEKLCKPQCQIVPSSITIKTLTSKCWNRSSAPKDLIASIPRGFAVTSQSQSADVVTQRTFGLPGSCSPMRQQLSARGDGQCYLQAYPVQRAGPLLCVTEQPTQQCKRDCDVGDTIPTQMRAKCWNERQAPQQVRDAVYQSYTTSAVAQAGQFSQQLSVQRPTQCHLQQHHHL